MSETKELTNHRLTIEINDHGAELSRIYDRENNYEILWNADPKFWNRHSPVLFPIVGRLCDGTMRWQGKTYSMSQHGFARDQKFTLVEHSNNHITHRLQQNESSKALYPFDFTLDITHTLKEQEILIEWDVTNDTDGVLYFSIGGHPAFNFPPDNSCSQTDCLLSFGGVSDLTYIGLDSETGTAIPSQTHSFTSPDGYYPVTEHMFDQDALVFENNQIQQTSLLWPDGSPYLTLFCQDFPYLAVWSKPGAPFICLEPWYGRTDTQGFSGEFSEKAGIQKLEKGQKFHAQYSIHIH